MSELTLVKRVEVGVRGAMLTTPLQLCMENHQSIGDSPQIESFHDRVAIKIDDTVALVKDAP